MQWDDTLKRVEQIRAGLVPETTTIDTIWMLNQLQSSAEFEQKVYKTIQPYVAGGSEYTERSGILYGIRVVGDRAESHWRFAVRASKTAKDALERSARMENALREIALLRGLPSARLAQVALDEANAAPQTDEEFTDLLTQAQQRQAAAEGALDEFRKEAQQAKAERDELAAQVGALLSALAPFVEEVGGKE